MSDLAPDLAPLPETFQPPLPRSMQWKLTYPWSNAWRVAKSPRGYQCTYKDAKGRRVPCGGHVRAKIAEPGVYRRVCRKCGTVWWFELYPIAEGVLRFRWVDEEFALNYIQESERDTQVQESDSES